MKKILFILITAVSFISCNNEENEGSFTVIGNIKNVSNQKIYLEELYFSQRPPEVLDTAEVKNGKFTISAKATQQGLYRLRLEDNTVFFFINDQPKIEFAADASIISLQSNTFKSPINQQFKRFIIEVDTIQKSIASDAELLRQQKLNKEKDSILTVTSQAFAGKVDNYKNYIIQYIDTTTNAVMAMIALGYTREIETKKLEKAVTSLEKRFPLNNNITTLVAQYKQLLQQQMAKPQDGALAPDFSLPDANGKLISLSSFKGKYVLIDFWASWCRPCREENPNVVAAFNQFKDKNFTVLGVSLDKNKESWLNAIQKDNLTWTQVSDLKEWESSVVPQYKIEGIPFNVLVNPEGKIIASDLRGGELMIKLKEVLQ
jgi:peroxiredoxin